MVDKPVFRGHDLSVWGPGRSRRPARPTGPGSLGEQPAPSGTLSHAPYWMFKQDRATRDVVEDVKREDVNAFNFDSWDGGCLIVE